MSEVVLYDKTFNVYPDYTPYTGFSYYALAPRVRALSDDARLTSVWLSRTSGLSQE